MNITAVIPVKANSSRFPGKNIAPFADSNLLVHKIRQLKEVAQIKEILVSSDSMEMLEMAKREGVRIEKRPDDLANESRPFGDLVCYIAEVLNTEHWAWTPCTSPTLLPKTYSKSIDTYFEILKKGFDSLTTTTSFKHFLLQNGKPFNFAPDRAITNSQDLPNNMKLWTCGCSIISAKLALERRYIFGENPFCFDVNGFEAMDIDTEFDYKIAKAMWDIQNG